MQVAVILEHRFQRTPDGAVWTRTMFPHSFWRRYLAVFDGVRVVARVEEVSKRPEDAKRVDGDGVEVVAVPYYVGPFQYARRAGAVKSAVRSAIGSDTAVILRVSSQLSNTAQGMLLGSGHPFAVEVVADPFDVFAPGSTRNPLRAFFRRYFRHNLRRQCARAAAAAYVTENALQRRYPPGSSTFATHYSSVELPDSAFVASPRPLTVTDWPIRLLFTGTLAVLYKAPDILIEAMALAIAKQMNVELTILGDGAFKPQLQEQAARLGIADKVKFLGSLPAGAAVREQMDAHDLFVLPSRGEGVPRAMIEAMARAMPCVGSCAGGIPELLPPEDMVPVGQPTALADKICEVIANPARMAAMSARNLKKAADYREDLLAARRSAMYRHLKAATQDWQRKRVRRAETVAVEMSR